MLGLREINRMQPIPDSGGRMDDDISRYATFRCAGCGALSIGFFEPDREGWGATVVRWMPLPGSQRESFAAPGTGIKSLPAANSQHSHTVSAR